MGTGLSVRACVNVQARTRLSELEHFCPVPICFGSACKQNNCHSLYSAGCAKDPTLSPNMNPVAEASRRKAARMRLWARNFVMILRGGGAADSLHISKAHPRKSAQKIRPRVCSSRFSSVFTEKAPERIVLRCFRDAFRRLNHSNFSTEMPASAKSLPANSSG